MKILILVILVLTLVSIILAIKFLKPNGLLQIDMYIDKDFYRMLYFTPIENLKKHRYLVLKVKTDTYNKFSEDVEEDF